MARFLHYEACPRCQENGRDNAGDNLAVYDDCSTHCFSCGRHRSALGNYNTVKETFDAPKNVLPIDFSREVPARAWQWLLQFGLPHSYWVDHVGWSEKDSRLVFAIPNIASVAFSQGRLIPDSTVGTGNGKALRKWFNYGNAHEAPYLVGNPDQAKLVVITEDWISAHKIAALAAETVTLSAFGTTIFPSIVPLLRYLGLPCIIWLDNDQRGTVERKAMHLSSLTGVPTSVRYSECDPKLLSAKQIKEILYE